MKLIHYTRQDGLIQLIALPPFILVENWILLGDRYWTDGMVFIVTTLIMLVILYPHWFINNAISLYFHRLYPDHRQFLRREIPSVLALSVSSCSFTTLAYVCYSFVGLPGIHVQAERLMWGLLFVVFIVLLVSTVYEGVNYFERWERTLRETEQLKKANLLSQFEGLKSQISPHFLFNSLNSLSSLIDDAPEQAEQFVSEMSSVYRYLLRANETDLVPLIAEMEFARSYFHLLHTRYGDHIRLEQLIDDRYTDYLLPPLTLQLLLENAVKHNIILPDQPLHISIETRDDDRLVVRNNLQRKTSRLASERIGLSNITTQYRLLGEDDVQVQDDNQFFTVTLPLIRRN